MSPNEHFVFIILYKCQTDSYSVLSQVFSQYPYQYIEVLVLNFDPSFHGSLIFA